jgi:DNA-binding transcriptional MerR regulator
MSIGEAAAAVGVSAKAIRIWEARGLLPKASRTSLGHRAFTEQDLARMRFIQQAKLLGLTLGEIADIIDLHQNGGCPCARVAEAIDARLAVINQQMAQLLELREVLTAGKTIAERYDSGSPGGRAWCPIIEEATISRDRLRRGGAPRS